jgi:putative FmdB family regulatory protein
MPTYQYRCAKCGDQFEEWQSIHDAPLKRHRGGCGGKLDKVMSAAGIVLKGPGFYKTDNRVSSAKGSSKKEKDGASSDSSSSSDGQGSGGSGSDGRGSESKSSNGTSGDSAKPAAKGSGSSSPTPSKSAAPST